MKQVKFVRGRTVYTEGVSNPDAVYFIRDGEFEVTKTIKSSDTVDQDD